MSVELLPTRHGQPLTMTVATDDPDGGHWYSPEFVRAAVDAAYERAAQEREPLSDTMVIACARAAIARIQPDEWVATDADLIDFARAIESEHGIGGSDE